MREEILTKGFNVQKNTFTQHYNTTEVDASLLQLPTIGIVDATGAATAATGTGAAGFADTLAGTTGAAGTSGVTGEDVVAEAEEITSEADEK